MTDQGKNKEEVTENDELDPKSVPTNSRDNNNRRNGNTNSETSRQLRVSGEITVHGSQTELDLIKKIKEKKEVAKQKNFTKLPVEPELLHSSCVRENVGDDLTKKNEIHILCECEPNVTGAAVPTVISFIDNQQESLSNNSSPEVTNNNSTIISRSKDVLEKTTSTDNSENNPKDDHAKNSNESMNKDVQQGCSTRKPSLIPKLNKGVTVNRNKRNYRHCSKDRKSRETSRHRTQNIASSQGKRLNTEKCEQISSSSSQGKRLNTEKSEQISSSSLENAKHSKLIPPKGYRNPSVLHKKSELDKSASDTVSSRMTCLQETLNSTTSMLRQKMETDKGSEQASLDETYESGTEEAVPEDKKTVDDLYKNISQLKNVVLTLSESNTFNGQRKYIERLFKNISEIKHIAKMLCDFRNNSPEVQIFQCVESESKNRDVNDDNNEIVSAENEKRKKHPVNLKDNKIRITFLNHDGKKRSSDGECRRSEEVQTVLSLNPKLISESLNSITCLISKIKDTDSMDGVFIPTYEPPANMEDEEETYGLDITITFPEIEHLVSDETESHLPVCVSDISAEALKKLKRCPKDFKLLMDFVEGKVSFQSGAGPANNFSMGPDLKFVANVDYKKSEVINIKPSTECLYSSQMIPVECAAKPKLSMKSLKSTDSELLLNVVNFPFLYRNPYRDYTGGHNSCVAIRNERLLSVAMIANQFFKSMPQIPSLTNIFEADVVDNFSKTDSGTKKEKSTDSEEKD